MIHCFWWQNDWIIINIFVFLSHLNRVLNPPGGRSSNIFGGGYEQEAAPVNRNKMTNNVLNDNSNINGNQIDPPVNHSRCNPDRHKSNDIFGDGQSNQAANKPRRGLYLFFTWIKSTFLTFWLFFSKGYNPITGKLYEEEQTDREKSGAQHVLHQQQQAEEAQHKQNNQQETSAPPANNYHSSTKIHQPPGGKSTRLW